MKAKLIGVPLAQMASTNPIKNLDCVEKEDEKATAIEPRAMQVRAAAASFAVFASFARPMYRLRPLQLAWDFPFASWIQRNPH